MLERKNIGSMLEHVKPLAVHGREGLARPHHLATPSPLYAPDGILTPSTALGHCAVVPNGNGGNRGSCVWPVMIVSKPNHHMRQPQILLAREGFAGNFCVRVVR
jgi:hypothetical protein